MYGGFGPHGHEGGSLFPLPPCFHGPSPLAKKRATIGAEETGWAEVGGVSTLLLDNASSVWFEDEGFFAWLCYGVGNDLEIEWIRHLGNLCGMQRSRAWCGTPPILGVVNMVGTRNFTCYMGAL